MVKWDVPDGLAWSMIHLIVIYGSVQHGLKWARAGIYLILGHLIGSQDQHDYISYFQIINMYVTFLFSIISVCI